VVFGIPIKGWVRERGGEGADRVVDEEGVEEEPDGRGEVPVPRHLRAKGGGGGHDSADSLE